jgi:hypothetical protein
MMEGRIHEGELEPMIHRRLARIPPDDPTAGIETEPSDVGFRAGHCACIRIGQQDLGFGPEQGGGDAEDADAASEIHDPLGRLVSHESSQGLEQHFAPRVEFLGAEHTRSGIQFELARFAPNGLDARFDRARRFRAGARALVLLESDDPRARTIGDDDAGLVELAGQALDGRNDSE